jgi:hypothetical protein
MVKKIIRKTTKSAGVGSRLEIAPVVRRVTLLLLIFVFIVFAVLLFTPKLLSLFGLKTSRSAELTATAVIAARQAAEGDFESLRSSRISKLIAAGVTLSEVPNYSRKTDTCLLAGQEQGWVVKNWAQYCKFNATDLFETSLTRSELIQKIDATPYASTLFGAADKRPDAKRCDSLYRLSYKPVLSFLEGSPGKVMECTFSTVHLTSDAAKHYSIKVIRDFDEYVVDRTKSYIQLQSETMYFNQKIGCGKRQFMGCESPIELPVSGF